MNKVREKVRENRLRRILSRRGYILMKSRRRDPRALDYGYYRIIYPNTNFVIAGGQGPGFSFTLDDVEDWLENRKKGGKAAKRSGAGSGG
jgi:hypothetical protein